MDSCLKDLYTHLRPEMPLPPLSELEAQLKEVKERSERLMQEAEQALRRRADAYSRLRGSGEAEADPREDQQWEEVSRLKQCVEQLEKELDQALEERKKLQEDLLTAEMRKEWQLLKQKHRLLFQ